MLTLHGLKGWSSIHVWPVTPGVRISGRDRDGGQGRGTVTELPAAPNGEMPHSGVAGLSPLGVDQPPGHGPNLIEEVESGVGSAFADGPCLGQESKMGIDLFG